MEKLLQKLVVSASLFASLGACGGSQPPAETPPGSTAAATEAPADAPMPDKFHDMNRDQRLMFMKETVMPKMAEAFQKFDAKRYAEFSCATCHGQGAKDGSFTMPSPDLPKLPATPEAFAPVAEKHPDMVKFMSEVVTPVMADLLKEEKFDPQTHKGFGCSECHTIEGS